MLFQNRLALIATIVTFHLHHGAVASLEISSFSTETQSESEFDFIVVGGGTAGCVLAGRLSDPKTGNYNVLLLEAGGFPHAGLDIPALTPNYLAESYGHARIYETIPQRSAGLWRGGRVEYMAGQTLGGGSSINGCMLNRGSPYDYDNWANITGDPSWKYENMLRHFRRVEDYMGDFPSDTEHGGGGPITVSRPKFTPGLVAWFEAGQYLGYPIRDPNGPQMVSFTTSEFSKRFGRRVSSFTSYLVPVLGRRNLKVITNAVVSRVIFEGDVAVGVMYKKNGVPGEKFVRARKEVILSAGVMGSASILLKSGIGPKDVLKSSRITPVKHLSVGMNLLDHPFVTLNILLNDTSAVFQPELELTPESLDYFYRHGDGPYSSFGSQLQAFIALSQSTNKNWADIHIIYGQDTSGYSNVSALYNGAGAIPDRSPSEVAVSCNVFISRPKSVGRITLNPTNPLNSDPLIDFQYYSDPQDSDMKTMIEGLHFILRVFEETPSFQKLGARYSSVPIEACQHLKYRSDDYWRCYIRERTTSGLHGAGTCKMGNVRDPTAVVDPQLKVIGVKNLRVVDTSIMPVIPTSNLQAAVYGIAEKAVDMILLENNKF